jgi:NAD(P) transhydrogenase subunit alpha
MGEDLIFLLYVFVLAMFAGYEVITKVPPILHTPLMSGANAISGVCLVGAIIVSGPDEMNLSIILGLITVVFATSTWSAASW